MKRIRDYIYGLLSVITPLEWFVTVALIAAAFLMPWHK